jgi:hypothetical protein
LDEQPSEELGFRRGKTIPDKAGEGGLGVSVEGELVKGVDMQLAVLLGAPGEEAGVVALLMEENSAVLTEVSRGTR